MHSENWDDLRYVLAVAEAGTVSGAARALQVNHATVLRRISAFETRHDIVLFEKSVQGYRVPPDRLRLIEAMREVAAAKRSVDLILQGTRAPLSGLLRVTSTDTLCKAILPDILARLRTEAAELRVELISSNTHLDLTRMHADIAVRPTPKLPDDMFGNIAAELGFDVYAAPGTPEHWIGMTGALSRSLPGQWMAGAVDEDDRAGSSDSFLVLSEMAATGQGQAVLPCYLGDPDPRLERRRGAMPRCTVPLWVASHSDLADVPRIGALRARLTEGLSAIAPRLLGD